MPRPKKDISSSRISITLPDDFLPILTEFAEINGVPRSTSISNLLLDMRPTIESLIEVNRLSKTDKKSALLHAQQVIGASFLDINQRNLFDD